MRNFAISVNINKLGRSLSLACYGNPENQFSGIGTVLRRREAGSALFRAKWNDLKNI
jgi:hypothetical protein